MFDYPNILRILWRSRPRPNDHGREVRENTGQLFNGENVVFYDMYVTAGNGLTTQRSKANKILELVCARIEKGASTDL